MGDRIQSMSETVQGLEGLSNQQIAARVLEAWEPVVRGNLTESVANLREVIQQIELDHLQQQARLDEEVETISNMSELAANCKEDADEANRDLQGCFETQRRFLQAVVEAQDLEGAVKAQGLDNAVEAQGLDNAVEAQGLDDLVRV